MKKEKSKKEKTFTLLRFKMKMYFESIKTLLKYY